MYDDTKRKYNPLPLIIVSKAQRRRDRCSSRRRIADRWNARANAYANFCNCACFACFPNSRGIFPLFFPPGGSLENSPSPTYLSAWDRFVFSLDRRRKTRSVGSFFVQPSTFMRIDLSDFITITVRSEFNLAPPPPKHSFLSSSKDGRTVGTDDSTNSSRTCNNIDRAEFSQSEFSSFARPPLAQARNTPGAKRNK